MTFVYSQSGKVVSELSSCSMFEPATRRKLPNPFKFFVFNTGIFSHVIPRIVTFVSYFHIFAVLFLCKNRHELMNFKDYMIYMMINSISVRDGMCAREVTVIMRNDVNCFVCFVDLIFLLFNYHVCMAFFDFKAVIFFRIWQDLPPNLIKVGNKVLTIRKMGWISMKWSRKKFNLSFKVKINTWMHCLH